MNSDYPEVIALKLMMTTANISGGTNYAIYDLSTNDAQATFPCFIIDCDTDIKYDRNVYSGELVVGFYDVYNKTLGSPQQNILSLQSRLRAFVNQLRLLSRTGNGYILDPIYRITPGGSLDSNASGVAGTQRVFTTFAVEWGFRE